MKNRTIQNRSNRWMTPLFATLLLAAASSHATVRTWVGGGSDSSWTNGINWGGTPPAINGDSLVFSGNVQQSNTNTYTAITNSAITFSTGGWSLWGNPVALGGTLTSSLGTNVMNLDTPLTATRTITVSAGQLTMNGAVSGTGYGLTKSGAGVLVLSGTNTQSGTTTVSSGAGTAVVTGPYALGTGNVSIPKGGTVTGTLQLALQGTNTITNTFAGFASTTGGATAVPDIENVSGVNTLTSPLTVTSTGGNGVTIQSDPGGLLILNGVIGTTQNSRYVELYGAGNGIVNGTIQNGTGTSFPIVKWGTGTWTLNGTNTFTGSTTVNAGTVVLGTTGSISNSTPVSLGAGSVFDVSAVPGGWVLGSGKTLSGTGTILGSVATATSATTTLTPGSTTTQGTLAFTNNLTLGGNTVINMNLSSDPTGLLRPSDQITVGGNLTANGVNTFTLGTYLNGFIPNGTFPLIQFAGTLTGSAANFAVTGFAAGARGVQSGYVTTSPGVVSLVVTGTPPANLTWLGDGSANNWDITTSTNWLNGGVRDAFFNYDAVTLNDLSTNFSVSLPSTVIPGSVTVNTTNSYTIGGADISGATGLTKLGTGTLTLTGNNTYTGVTTYSGGQISVATIGAGGAASPLGAAANASANQYLNGGTLEYTGSGESSARAFSIGPNGGTVSVDTVGVTLTFTTSGSWTSSGGNGLTKTGPGTLAFTFQEVLIGTNTILGGILKIPTLALFGTDVTTPVFINGGALDVNGQSLGVKPVVVSGMGDLTITPGTTNGAIVNSGAAQTTALQYVTMTGDTAFGGTGRWDIRANPTASLSTSGHAYNLVKAGANQVSLVSAVVDPALANIDVQAGTLSFEVNSTGLGNPANTLTLRPGATFQMYAATNLLNKQLLLQDTATINIASGINTIVGPINLLGDTGGGPTFNVVTNVALNVSGMVSGPGSLTKSGPGTLTLTATNTYTGATTINGGELVVNCAQTGTGAITLGDNTGLGVKASGAAQLSPSMLTFGSGAGYATNEFTGLASTTTAPINTPTLVINDPTTINILSGSFAAGHSYPLIAFGTINGTAGFTLGTLPPLLVATIVTNGNTIALNVTSSPSIEVWKGTINAHWDVGTTANWSVNGTASTYADGNTVQFDDSASNANVLITTTVMPKAVFVNNSAKDYALGGSAIAGTASLTKLGSGALTLSGANNYSGGTTLSSGTLNLNNNTALGAAAGAFTINGGIIDNTGSGPVTLVNNNLENWNGDFAFGGNQNLNLGAGLVLLSGTRQVAPNGSVLTVGGSISDSGLGFGLTLNGPGTLTLAGSNTYSGVTTISQGTLNVNGPETAAAGGYLVGPAATAVATANFNGGSVVVVASTNTIQVGNTIPSGTGGNQTLNVAGIVTNNGTLYDGREGIVNVNAGALWVQIGDMSINGQGGYSSVMTVASNASFIYSGPDTVKIEPMAGNTANATLTLAGGTFTTGQGFEQTTASSGLGTLALTSGGTIVLAAALPELIVVNSATAVFSLGAGGGVIDTAGHSTDVSVDVTGTGDLTKKGAGTLSLSYSPISYTGNTFINGGSLALLGAATLASTNIVIGAGAVFDVSGLAFLPYALVTGQSLGNNSSPGILNGSVTAVSAGISLTYAAGTPALSVTNGTLTFDPTTTFMITNTGAPLSSGNYKLISTNLNGALAGTAPTTATFAGNGLAAGATASLAILNGELYLTVVGGVNTTPVKLTSAVSGSNLNLSWPADHTGWRLLIQTNSLNVGLRTNWSTWPGSATTNAVSIPIVPSNPAVFMRLVYP